MQANILKYQSLNSAEFKQSANTLNLLEQPLDDLFQLFDPITLEKTNKSSLMLKRYDNKYVVDRPQFEEFLSLVHENYVILEIKGTRQFSYSSCYYDDNHQCYLDHL